MLKDRESFAILLADTETDLIVIVQNISLRKHIKYNRVKLKGYTDYSYVLYTEPQDKQYVFDMARNKKLKIVWKDDTDFYIIDFSNNTKGDIICWICQDYNNTGRKNCPTAVILEQDVYSILLNVFKSYEKYKDEITQELLYLYNEVLYKQENASKEIELKNTINSLLVKKEKLLDLTLDGILNKDDLKAKSVIIKNQITDLKAKLEKVQKQATKKNQKQYLNMLEKNIMKNLNINETNIEQYIEKFLDKIIVKDNEEKSELQISLNTKESIVTEVVKIGS